MTQGSDSDRNLTASSHDRPVGKPTSQSATRSTTTDVPWVMPVAVSVFLHIALMALMWVTIDSSQKMIEVPRHIQAVMIDDDTLKAMMQATQPAPKPEPQPQPKPQPKPEPKPEPKPVEKPPKPPQPDPEVVRLKEQQAKDQAAAEKARIAAEKEQARIAELALKKKKDEEKRKREAQAKLEQEKKNKAFLEQQRIAQEKQRELDRKEREKAREAERQAELAKAEQNRKSAEEQLLADEAAQFEKMFDKQASKQPAQQTNNAQLQAMAGERERLIQQITEKIERSWIEPPGQNRGLEVDIRLELLPTGELKTARITSSSGNSGFDQSALNAAYSVSRYPVPRDTALFNADFRNITIKFRPK
ncbi:MAG: protein TolA [unclassified Hahellaceae]|nr:protein TolA [Hahellaceae bacterium]|tara:strand:- start:58480 stop:59562 length:1083 start_codon:yes stop_codon:yes gene_type:complete